MNALPSPPTPLVTPPPPSLASLLADEMGRFSALFLDIDGTLLELKDDPQSVRADQGLLNILDWLQVRLDGALALVSGRDLDSVDSVMAPRRFPAAASHGAELRLDPAAPPTENPTNYKLLRHIGDDLQRLVDEEAVGLYVERKNYSIALHYRRHPDALTIAAAVRLARLALIRLGDGFRIRPGKDVLELAPAGVDKGSAILAFLDAPPFSNRRPIFIGDDLTDEDGFIAVNNIGGVSIHIGALLGSMARYALPDPAALRAWLAAGVADSSQS